MSFIFMRSDKQEAIKLRLKGLSYSQIQTAIGASKSTLSIWLKDIQISKKAQERINHRVHTLSRIALVKRNKERPLLVQEKHNSIREEGKKEFRILFKDRAFISGVSLYWAEGYKKGAIGSKWKSIDFANSDPEMVAFMVNFFCRYLEIPKSKIKMQIIAHRNINMEAAVQYWSKVTGITTEQFIKSSIINRKNTSKNPRKGHLTHGTVHVRINDVQLFFRLIGWLDGLKIWLPNMLKGL